MLVLCLHLTAEAQGPFKKAYETDEKESGLSPFTATEASSANTGSLAPTPSCLASWRQPSGKPASVGAQLSCHVEYDVIPESVVARTILPAVTVRGPRTGARTECFRENRKDS